MEGSTADGFGRVTKRILRSSDPAVKQFVATNAYETALCWAVNLLRRAPCTRRELLQLIHLLLYLCGFATMVVHRPSPLRTS
jgi:hypothetical protein